MEESMLVEVERLRDALANIQQLREPDWLPDVTEGDEVLDELAPPWLQAVVLLLGKTNAEAERLTEKSEYVENTLDSFETVVEVFVSALWVQTHGFDAPTIRVCKGWRLVSTD